MDLITGIFISIVTALILSAIGYCIAKIKGIIKKQSAIENGVQALLRDRIIQLFNHYSSKNFMPIYARENAESLFREYSSLGGNGTVSGLVEMLMRLPVDNSADSDKEDRSVIND